MDGAYQPIRARGFIEVCDNAAFTRQTKVEKLVLANCWRQKELVSICRQQFANMFAISCCVFHTRQLEFPNLRINLDSNQAKILNRFHNNMTSVLSKRIRSV